MKTYLRDLQDLKRDDIGAVGGKAANLGELSRIEGVAVPDGFCISTDVYHDFVGSNGLLRHLLHELSTTSAQDYEGISQITARIRNTILETPLPNPFCEAITSALARLGAYEPYAVRSSATAEDLPTASFAGQQDTFLNVIGSAAILSAIVKCWASLFTERAVSYRIEHGFDHRKVQLAVVVQKMVLPAISGIMFTADPLTSNRKVVSIDASFGLGEALVSGKVNPDVFKVREGAIVERKISEKKLAVYPLENGGVKESVLPQNLKQKPALSDEQVLALERIGRKIEAHFGSPQDIEWCIADDQIFILQSRPLTTLFPLPERNDDLPHVYLSVGHQQMMTDAMKPLGLDMWYLITRREMFKAGGRLFVDVASQLASPARDTLINVLGKFDPLNRDALQSILLKENFIKTLPAAPATAKTPDEGAGQASPDYQTLADFDPAVVRALIRRSEISLEALRQDIQGKSGVDLFDFILEDIAVLRTSIMDKQSFGVLMTAMNAAAWINEHMKQWLGEKSAADVLSLSVPENISSEMGLALLDLADTIRPSPELVSYLQWVKSDDFLESLPTMGGGREVAIAINTFLTRFGMRCPGEIDITRPRWIEKPSGLLPVILSNVKNNVYGAGKLKFEEGLKQAAAKEQDLLERLRTLPGGEEKARETERMIFLMRNLSGYREYPKYSIINRTFIYKQALLKEAEKLRAAGLIREIEDVYYLSFDEFRTAVLTQETDADLIRQRKDEHRFFERLMPPRVMTSDGEIFNGSYHRQNVPADALIGLAVSSGIVEGRARVILDFEKADLQQGDILVTRFTDPSWTPLFLSVSGLVTEVGGLMTHGAVIAREYGLPAIVGLDNATRLIKDGQHIRLNGTEGYVELL